MRSVNDSRRQDIKQIKRTFIPRTRKGNLIIYRPHLKEYYSILKPTATAQQVKKEQGADRLTIPKTEETIDNTQIQVKRIKIEEIETPNNSKNGILQTDDTRENRNHYEQPETKAITETGTERHKYCKITHSREVIDLTEEP